MLGGLPFPKDPEAVIKRSARELLHKICENTGFHWPVFSSIRTELYILSLHRRIWVSENPYLRIFYADSKYKTLNMKFLSFIK